MRILVANWSLRKAGGVETYLDKVVPALAARGHDLAFWYETDEPLALGAISGSRHLPRWSPGRDGLARALHDVAAWRPDCVWVHWLSDPAQENGLIQRAPSVRFAHAYHGTCISGTKMLRYPIGRPCGRRFGPACLVQYYPRRCGGLSPLTALGLYAEQGRRLAVARRADRVVTISEHMRREMVRHGLEPDRVQRLPWPPLEDAPDSGPLVPRQPANDGSVSREAPGPPGPSRLLFVGRMDLWKGGTVLLDALPRAAEWLGRRLTLTFAGDGPRRRDWERHAARLRGRDQQLTIRFVGWADEQRRRELFAEHDALVVPSIWPEPFGLVGLEAAAHGLPAIGFAVGGIPEWLEDGVNGCLAPGDPPTVRGLTCALIRGLETPAAYGALRHGALDTVHRASLAAHVSALVRVFEAAAGGRSLSPAG